MEIKHPGANDGGGQPGKSAGKTCGNQARRLGKRLPSTPPRPVQAQDGLIK